MNRNLMLLSLFCLCSWSTIALSQTDFRQTKLGRTDALTAEDDNDKGDAAVWATPTLFTNNAGKVPVDHASTLENWQQVIDPLLEMEIQGTICDGPHNFKAIKDQIAGLTSGEAFLIKVLRSGQIVELVAVKD